LPEFRKGALDAALPEPLADAQGLVVGAFCVYDQESRSWSDDDTPPRDVAREVLNRVGMAPMANAQVDSLPTGLARLVELGRALATRPRLLLLDEVLAGLNPQEIAEMMPVVRGIADSGVTVLMIEHVMQAVMNLAEHVWVLAQGRLIAEGNPAQVTSDDRVVEAYLGHGTAARLRKAAAGASA